MILMATIAVIVTTYNNPLYLTKVLAGFLEQTKRPDELIVGDDGSGERTAEVIREFQHKADFPIKHIWQEDRGFRAAHIRNKCIKASGADYLIFIDGDCVPSKTFIEDHFKIKRKGCFMQGKRVLISEKISKTFKPSPAGKEFLLYLSGQINGCRHLVRLPGVLKSNTKLKGIRSCNFAVHRDDLLAVNGFNEDYVGWGREDSDLAVRLMKYGLKRLDVLFAAIVYHLWHRENNNEGLANNDKRLEETIYSQDYYCKNGIFKNSKDAENESP